MDKGHWDGKYSFVVKDWKGFRQSPMVLKYKCLMVMMHLVNKILGRRRIRPKITATPGMEIAGVANKDYRVTKFGITLFYSNEVHCKVTGSINNYYATNTAVNLEVPILKSRSK